MMQIKNSITSPIGIAIISSARSLSSAFCSGFVDYIRVFIYINFWLVYLIAWALEKSLLFVVFWVIV